ncbi:MAG: SDR family NAD(P)-dependent oxidoreductase [Hyphomicrobiaceae bacterium]
MTTHHRSILITGCSTGIGFAAARDLKLRGWRVLATARKADDLARLTAQGVDALPLELADPASIAACATRALELTDGRLGALFSNAAYGQIGAVEDLEVQALRDQFEVNFFGLHDLTRRVIPAMRRQGAGRIVQCSSILGLMAAPYRGAYCASKYALEALTDSMRMELHGSGIHVSLIEPGPIRTEFLPTALAKFRERIDIDGSAHRETYQRRLASMATGGKTTFKLEPEAVVRRLIHAVESSRPKPRYFVTTPTYIAAMLKRVLPTVVLDPFARGQ